MGKNNNIIEINNQRYDVNTGKLLEDSPEPLLQHDSIAVSPTTKSHTNKPLVVSPTNVKVPAATSTTKSSHHQRAARQTTARNVRSHAPEHAKTLMRNAVKKPQPSHKHHLKASSPIDTGYGPSPLAPSSKISLNSHEKRLSQAQRTPKSPAISHYGPLPALAPLPAYNPPVASVTSPVTAVRPAATGSLAPHGRQPMTTAEMLDRAIARATSHQERPPKIKKPKTLKHHLATYSGAAVAVIVLAFVAFQNVPNIKLERAASRAGFAASLPTHEPTGFSLGKMTYSTGLITLHFQNNSNRSQNYTLTEQTSNWDSDTLRDTFVKSAASSYQTVTAAGRKIYLYDNGSVTWVSSGIWYQVQSDGSLTNQQLIDLASSL